MQWVAIQLLLSKAMEMNEIADFDTVRRSGIGGSDTAAVLGISPWKTPYDLWCEKIGIAAPLVPSEQMHWGSLLEPVITAEYARRSGNIVEPVALLRHPTHTYMLGHLDGRIDHRRILEVKTARTGLGWGEPGTAEIPLQYLCQVHHYLTVSGAALCDVAVLIGGSDFRVYTVERDDAIARDLVAQEHRFWQAVINHEPPEPVNTEDALHRWGKLTVVGMVTATEHECELVARLRQIKEHQRGLVDEAEAAKLVLMQALADRGDTLFDAAGNVLATWRMDNGRKAYTVPAREPSRRFLLKD